MQKTKTQESFLSRLQNIVAPDRLLVGEPMSGHTTFKIGGPADYLVLPASTREVADVLAAAREYRIPVIVLGNGSNVLVRDKGIRGLVLKFGDTLGAINHFGTTVIAGAGAALGDVVRYAASHGLTGLEFAVGIPGSIGGAVFMNAGAYEGEVGCLIAAVTAVCPTGHLQRFTHDEIGFGYRDSIFQHNNCIICEVELKLAAGDNGAISRKIDEYTHRREAKQPIEMPSAGSTFKRPPGHFAGTLIEQSGLKGCKIGGAQVSEKHAGFIINTGGATATDVLSLIKEVQRQVNAKYGIKLQPEVRIIGEE